MPRPPNSVVLDIPGIPVPKGRPRAAVWGRGKYRRTVMYTDKKTQAGEARIAEAARKVFRDRDPLTGPLLLRIVFHMPIPASWPKWKKAEALEGRLLPAKKPDPDNLEKLVMDGLNGVAYTDDAQVLRVHHTKLYGEEPRTWIKITPLQGHTGG